MPTRTVVAWLMPSGTMKASEARVQRDGVRGESSWPSQPCSSEAEVNSSTSASSIRPMGRPMRKIRGNAASRRMKKRLKMW